MQESTDTLTRISKKKDIDLKEMAEITGQSKKAIVDYLVGAAKDGIISIPVKGKFVDKHVLMVKHADGRIEVNPLESVEEKEA